MSKCELNRSEKGDMLAISCQHAENIKCRPGFHSYNSLGRDQVSRSDRKTRIGLANEMLDPGCLIC